MMYDRFDSLVWFTFQLWSWHLHCTKNDIRRLMLMDGTLRIIPLSLQEKISACLILNILWYEAVIKTNLDYLTYISIWEEKTFQNTAWNNCIIFWAEEANKSLHNRQRYIVFWTYWLIRRHEDRIKLKKSWEITKHW